MPEVLLAGKETALKLSKKLQCDIIRAKSPLRISFTGGGTLVLLQDAADLPVHRRRIEVLL